MFMTLEWDGAVDRHTVLGLYFAYNTNLHLNNIKSQGLADTDLI